MDFGIKKYARQQPYRRNRAGKNLFHRIRAVVSSISNTHHSSFQRQHGVCLDNIKSVQMDVNSALMVSNALLGKLINIRSVSKHVTDIHYHINDFSSDLVFYHVIISLNIS